MSQAIVRPQATEHLTQEQMEQFIADGYVVVPGLIDLDRVQAGLQELEDKAGVRPEDPTTWPEGKAGWQVNDRGIDRMMCVSSEMESVVRELAGETTMCNGITPMLRFPQGGPKEFEPGGAHIDGTRQKNGLTMYPTHFRLLVMGYLTDTESYGAAFTVWPGSPRQIFEWAYCNDVDLGEKWRKTGNTSAPDIPLNDPMPVVARAGDVAICHYLMIHASSVNHDDHVRVGLHGWLKATSDYEPKIGGPQADWTPLDWSLRTDYLERVEAV